MESIKRDFAKRLLPHKRLDSWTSERALEADLQDKKIKNILRVIRYMRQGVCYH
jgi:hypothetical protein